VRQTARGAHRWKAPIQTRPNFSHSTSRSRPPTLHEPPADARRPDPHAPTPTPTPLTAARTPTRTPPNAARTPRENTQEKFSGERLKKNGVRREQPARVAQVLPSLRALASPLYSVWNTLSRATLNAFALVLVLPSVNLLSHFCPSTEKTPRRHPRPT